MHAFYTLGLNSYLLLDYHKWNVMSVEGTQWDEAQIKASFLEDLFIFMANRGTAIKRIPILGFKDLDLYLMFKTVWNFGGFDRVTTHLQWRQVYNVLGGHPQNTSGATHTRRHYEKLLLDYERHLTSEGDKVVTPPHLLKHSHHYSIPLLEDEGPSCSKYSDLYRLDPALTQRSPDVLTDSRAWTTLKTLYNQPLLDPSHPAPPTYHSVFPNMPPPQAQPHPQPHPQRCQEPSSLPHQTVIDRSKQQLAKLQELVNENRFSLGWGEPLNLSRRGGGRDALGRRLPPFTPPPSNKVPKFLNRVSPLYSA
ncbi:hypothetical protein AAFF_G00086250 [Aldrovandia affinis]|uniref:ARID domain-containing protein n=1 Tax=Aldrovandia affinis TaxID=143900 RepID=A0AAD7RWS3_9TELE|nr:hypothetical protein AAFF_G00086250 [Aldrovandia affinis]